MEVTATDGRTVTLPTARFQAVRAQTDALAKDLSSEDACVQSMDDTSPTKWHLAHTTWFFETFVLAALVKNYAPFDPNYCFLFNSYYHTIGEHFARPHRGLLTRPSLAAIRDYRAHIDNQIVRLIESGLDQTITRLIELGLHHEQQHQELMLMDIKHLFSCNPTYPAYIQPAEVSVREAPRLSYREYDGGTVPLGADAIGFSFDNERPRHETLLQSFALASRPATNQEYLDFIRDGGYNAPLVWLADGWTTIQKNNWRTPLYWREIDGNWFEFTLAGLRPLDLDAPVAHVSYYEADAYARWANARLATEVEWETAASELFVEGNFVETGRLHPQPSGTVAAQLPSQMFGDVWEWTMSPYTPYPGFLIPPNAIGEYNGKFMSGQMVLRGGCCISPVNHLRSTYRNFFYPHNRWQFGGIRLARNA